VAAAKLALSYLVGKPEKAVDPDTLDEQEWHIWRRYAASSEWVELIQCLPLDVILNLVRSVWPVLAAEKCAQGQALFTTADPAAPEAESEAAGGKTRTRRRGGKRRKPEAEERDPGAEGLTGELPVEEARPPDCSGAAGGAAADRRQQETTQEASASECAAEDQQAKCLPHGAGAGGQRPEEAPRGQAGTLSRADGPGALSRQQGAKAVPPVALRDGPNAPAASEADGEKHCPSANGSNGAGAAPATTVNKPRNRPDLSARRPGAGDGGVADG
jgi:hypothetical protein